MDKNATIFTSTIYSPYLRLESAEKAYIFLSRIRNKLSAPRSLSHECDSTAYVENCLIAYRI